MNRTGFPLQLRVVDEGILEGIAVPWNEITYLTDDPQGERFLPGSLTRTVKDRGARLKLFLDHDHSHAIGKALKLDPRHPQGLWSQWQLFDTPAGRDARLEVEQGALDMFSVGFQPVRQRRGADGVREVQEAAVYEVTLTPLGAYDGARVLATRSASTDSNTCDVNAWLDQHPMPQIDLTQPAPLLRP